MTARTPTARTQAAAPPLRLPNLRRRYDFECIAFAGGVKEMLEVALSARGIDHAVLHEPHLKEQPLREFHGATPRRLMQSLGDWGRQICGDLWVQDLSHRVGLVEGGHPVHDRLLVTDVRYPNEEAWLHEHGGVLLRITRQAAGRTDTHSSEMWSDSLLAHASIPNEGSIGGLHTQLDQIMAMMEVLERPTDRAPA
jgi:hypothetical protein